MGVCEGKSRCYQLIIIPLSLPGRSSGTHMISISLPLSPRDWVWNLRLVFHGRIMAVKVCAHGACTGCLRPVRTNNMAHCHEEEWEWISRSAIPSFTPITELQ